MDLTEAAIRCQEKLSNLREEFDQYKKESIKWSIDDFTLYNHPTHTINEVQAQKALEAMISSHDACYGICWDTVEFYTREYGIVKE